MDRQSAKHGPIHDEQMKHETEGLVRGGGSTHAEEWKEPEPVDAATSPGAPREPGSPPGMTPDDVAWRSELAQSLTFVSYPAEARDIVACLRERHTADRVMEAIATLPADRTYGSVREVLDDLQVPVEDHRT